MTEQTKKTLGLAIASLVCGLFFIIPLLGLLLSLLAIIFGIIALVKISNNKETLKGNGFAIAGISLGVVGILIIPIIALMAAIAIPNLLRARISANDALAKSTLRTISTAAETYAASHESKFPVNEQALIEAVPPYMNRSYCEQTISGFKYSCRFDGKGYVFTAEPLQMGTTGTRTYTIETGGRISPEEKY